MLRKHIAPNNSYLSTVIIICTNKSPHLRVIISALEIVKSRLVVIDIAAVAERVIEREGVRGDSRNARNIAPCIVGILYVMRSVRACDPDAVTLCVPEIIAVPFIRE